jgi:hypothetical protein
VVHVDEGQARYATAGQSLGRPGTYTPNAHHDHMGSPDALCPGHAIQALQTAESACVVVVGYFQS